MPTHPGPSRPPIPATETQFTATHLAYLATQRIGFVIGIAIIGSVLFGNARVQAKNWRLMAAGLVSQSRGTPYVVEVDRAVQVRAVGAAVTPYRPTDAQIAYHLARFVTDVCSLSTDPVVVRQNWLEAYQPCRRRTLY